MGLGSWIEFFQFLSPPPKYVKLISLLQPKKIDVAKQPPSNQSFCSVIDYIHYTHVVVNCFLLHIFFNIKGCTTENTNKQQKHWSMPWLFHLIEQNKQTNNIHSHDTIWLLVKHSKTSNSFTCVTIAVVYQISITIKTLFYNSYFQCISLNVWIDWIIVTLHNLAPW